MPLGDRMPGAGQEARLVEAFSSAYLDRYGRPPPPVAAEVVSWRVRVSGPRPAFPLGAGVATDSSSADGAIKGWREAYFPEAGGLVRTAVVDRYRLGPGMRIRGPAIIEERESTVVLGGNGRVTVDQHHNLLLEAV